MFLDCTKNHRQYYLQFTRFTELNSSSNRYIFKKLYYYSDIERWNQNLF